MGDEENIYDPNPCDACREGMARGVTIIEVDAARERTGNWVVIKEEVAQRIFREHAFREDGTVFEKIAVDVEVFESYFGE